MVSAIIRRPPFKVDLAIVTLCFKAYRAELSLYIEVWIPPSSGFCAVIGIMIRRADSFVQTKLSFSPQLLSVIASVGKWGPIFNRIVRTGMFHSAAELCIYWSVLKHLFGVITMSNVVCRMYAETWEGFMLASLVSINSNFDLSFLLSCVTVQSSFLFIFPRFVTFYKILF